MHWKRYKSMQTKSLVGMGLQDVYSDQYWDIVAELNTRATTEMVEAAQSMFESANWHKRVMAVHILGEMTLRNPSKNCYQSYAVEQTHEILCRALRDQCLQVVIAALRGLGYRPAPEAVTAIMQYADHPDAQVRKAVAVSLGSYAQNQCLDVLLRLAADANDDVRDWATFSLNLICQNGIDTPAVRERLWVNMYDTYGEVRGEAILGLAMRKDPGVTDFLLNKTDVSYYGFCELEAAETLADPRLYPVLEKFWNQCSTDNDTDIAWLSALRDAMQACQPKE